MIRFFHPTTADALMSDDPRPPQALVRGLRAPPRRFVLLVLDAGAGPVVGRWLRLTKTKDPCGRLC